jgi:OHCU decarboxylase
LIASEAWRPLLPEMRLAADTRHFYARELTVEAPVTHVRLRIFPDGGVSRLRVWGERSPETRPSGDAIARLNRLAEEEARALLTSCCGAARWVEGMLSARPFGSSSELLQLAERIWRGLQSADYLEAFSHHPEIGSDLSELRRKFASTAVLSEQEQAGAAGASVAVLAILRAQNQLYRARFGYTFIVCASGKSADEMLELMAQRASNPPEVEIALAAAEQAKITRLRLEGIQP